MAKLTKDELKALREARINAMDAALRDFDLDTNDKRSAYADSCDASCSVLLVASVDEEGFHMTSANAVRYQPQDTGEGTLFLSGRKDIYLRKDFLEAQGYSEEDGWPVALNVSMAFPALVEAEAEKPNRKSARDAKTQRKEAKPSKTLKHEDVDEAAAKAGIEYRTRVELGENEQLVDAGKGKAKKVISEARNAIKQGVTKPKKPWLITSAKARTVIRDESAELVELGVPEDEAKHIVTAILRKEGYIRDKK